MEAHTKDGQSVRIEQVISVGLVANKARFQELAIKQEKPTPILFVKGYAIEHTSIPSKTNGRPTTYIKGAFEATNLLTNTNFISGQAILPDSASGYITAMMTKAHGPIYFELTVLIERSEKSVIGYKFLVEVHQLTQDQSSENK
jgi:hypothetical protein